MKKILLKILFLLFITNNVYSASFNWTKVVTTADGDTTWYYDKKSVFQVGSYRFYWQLGNYLKNYDEDKSVISHSMVNCDTYEMKWITYTGYSEHMGKGKTNFEAIMPEADPSYFVWEYFDPKTTVQGMVTEKVCNER